ncbi:MAG: helix-turn-helix transcriptional regulator, partial [Pirellulaceae bacterium]|nr:helix-turn-helix transcriptional regulator [Pirellulaceae bacterium]
MANTYKTDGEKIRELQGLQNQQQIAELAGISRNTYKKALDGGPSTLETLQKLARVFEVDVEELIVRQDSEPMIPFMAPELTSRFVQRPAESEKLVSQILKADHDHPIAITTAVVGTAGFGKTTLAMAL